jgi:divalent metal cation (Fe/Co/Zn/Cd) transporter
MEKARVEKIAGLSVAAAMGISGIVMMGLSISRISDFQPGGNVYLGLVIACLGLITNTWFWRRYTRMTQEQYNTVLDTQSQLYRAKSLVDLCVIFALLSVALAPAHPATRYIDISGSLAVAGYLMWSSLRSARTSIINSTSAFEIESSPPSDMS